MAVAVTTPDKQVEKIPISMVGPIVAKTNPQRLSFFTPLDCRATNRIGVSEVRMYKSNPEETFCLEHCNLGRPRKRVK
jgi:hypothetical protein